MTTSFAITGSSPLHCTLSHNGTSIYNVYTSVYAGSTTVLVRDGVTVASVVWRRSLTKAKLIIDGQSGRLKDLMPKTGMFARSRVFKSTNGKTLKWRDEEGLMCICPDTGLSLARHNGAAISPFEAKASRLEIFDQGKDVQDALVATWMIMESISLGRNPLDEGRSGLRKGRNAGEISGGGGWGGYSGDGGGCGDGGCGGDGGGGGGGGGDGGS